MKLRRILFIATMIAVTLLSSTASQSLTVDASKGTFIFTHVNVIPMDREAVLEDMNVVVSGGKIAAFGRAADVRIPAGAKVIDSRGKFLLPGLMDMHTHIEDDQCAPLYLAYGITRVRNMTPSDDGDHYNRRRRIADGTITGPVVYISGPAVMSNNPGYKFNVSSAEQARELVRKSKADGADWIKTIRMDMDIFHAILDEARKQGLPVAGHLPSLSAPILEIYRSGFRSHEHVTEVFTSKSFFDLSPDETKLMTVAQQIKETGIIISTILHREITWKRMREEGDAYLTDARVAELQRFTGEKGVKSAREFLENLKKEDEKAKERTGKIYRNIPFILKLIKALNDAGVPLVIGTDSHFYFSFAGLSLHEELDLLLEAGLTRYEAIRVATYNAALLLNALDKLGTLSVGKEADLVLVNNNPLTDIKTLRIPAGVMRQGRWFDRKVLDALLKDSTAGKQASTGFTDQHSEADIAKEKDAIRNIVETCYIDVLYHGGEIDKLTKGFHPDFKMYVLSVNKIDKRSLEQWRERLKAVRARRGATTNSDDRNRYRHEFKSIDVTGYTAVAKIEIFRDGKLEYTDYLTLYKFDDGWKVMTKLFTQHQ